MMYMMMTLLISPFMVLCVRLYSWANFDNVSWGTRGILLSSSHGSFFLFFLIFNFLLLWFFFVYFDFNYFFCFFLPLFGFFLLFVVLIIIISGCECDTGGKQVQAASLFIFHLFQYSLFFGHSLFWCSSYSRLGFFFVSLLFFTQIHLFVLSFLAKGTHY